MTVVRIWDFPTRVFHWLLAFCVMALVVTAKVGGNWMEWHLRLGHVVLALLVFRLLWGFLGGHWSRFSSFLYAPRTLWRYLRGHGQPQHSAGHSPLGALSVWAMLLVLLAQVGSGLFSDDEIFFAGPLTAYASGDWVGSATWFHKNWGQWLVLSLVAVHVLAIVFYTRFKRQTLVRPMLTGDKTLPEGAVNALPATRDGWPQRLLALLLLLGCAALARWVYGLGSAGF